MPEGYLGGAPSGFESLIPDIIQIQCSLRICVQCQLKNENLGAVQGPDKRGGDP